MQDLIRLQENLEDGGGRGETTESFENNDIFKIEPMLNEEQNTSQQH